jgi:tRNA nucleotidyltransferase (CCA-adding enzyme)
VCRAGDYGTPVPAAAIPGSRAERLERLRAVPGAAPVLAALAGEEGVHVVGGAVRDLLLGRAPMELDLVVEGDALAVARRAAARLGGTVTEHPRFGTATVGAGELVFDLASARSERYAWPGALPVVTPGASLAQDLARRDFSVNAIAMRLADGELSEWPGALDDLRAGVLRVLHDGSFLDDPTRLLRLARYAARLGFAPADGTAALAEAAVRAEATATVSGERLGEELRRLAREPQPAAFAALERHGAGAAVLGPAFHVDPALIESALALRPPDARADLLATAASLANFGRLASVSEGDRTRLASSRGVGAERDALQGRLRALSYRAAEARVVVAAATVERLGPALAHADRPSEVDAVLRREPPDAAVLAAALGLGPPGAVAAWLADARHRRLAITGHDLVAAGLRGPAVGAGLAAARAALLDGTAPTAEQQLAAALAAR